MKMHRFDPPQGKQPALPPKAVTHPSGSGFWPWHDIVQMSSYALAHPQLDMQEWFKEQVSQRTAHPAGQVLVNAQC